MIFYNTNIVTNPDHNKGVSNLILDAAYITESTAIACYDHIGRGNEKQADQAAVNAMREAMNKVAMFGKIVIGEGERDEAPMLYIGESVGCGDGPDVDIAVDPLEGTTLCAHAAANSIAVIAIGPSGTILNAPDIYMEKIAVGGRNLPKDLVSLEERPSYNINQVAKAKKKSTSEISVMILNRPRHKDLIEEVRASGAIVKLISDGDIAAAISTTDHRSGVDIYMGSGGAPEGVLASAALKVCGGIFQGKLLFDKNNAEQISRANDMGIEDLDKIYNIEDMVKSDVIFCATGVTDGTMLKGVKKVANSIITNTIVMHYLSGTVRMLTTEILSNR